MLRRINYSFVLLWLLLVALLALPTTQAQAIDLTATGERFTQDPANPRFYRNEFGDLQHEVFQQQVPYFNDVDYTLAVQATEAAEEKAQLMEDILHIQRIVQVPKEFLNLLQQLNSNAEDIRDGGNEVEALEQALSEMEDAHFFPTERYAALNALSDPEFVASVAEGRILNDIGPSVRHGEYTHRLQWAAIMADYDQNPNAWNYPPYELFTRIGEADVDRIKKGAGNLGVWFTLFDLRGQVLLQDGSSIREGQQPANGMKIVRDGFRHPERLGSLFGIPTGFMNQTKVAVTGATAADIASAMAFNTRKEAIASGVDMDKLGLIEIAARARYNQRLLGAFDAFRASGAKEYKISPSDPHFDTYMKSLAADMIGTKEFTTVMSSEDPARPKLVMMAKDFHGNALTTTYKKETKAIRRLAARAARGEPGATTELEQKLQALKKDILSKNLNNLELTLKLTQSFDQFSGQMKRKKAPRAVRGAFVPVLAFPDGEIGNLSKVMSKPIQEFMNPDVNPLTGTSLAVTDGESSSTTKTKTKIKTKKH